MLLKELPVGCDVTMHCYDANGEIDLKSKVFGYKDNVAIFSDVIVDSKIINFSSSKVRTDIVFYEGGKTVHRFKNVTIVNYNHKGKVMHFAKSDYQSVEENLRETPRFQVNKDCSFSFGSGSAVKLGTIRDVSMNGLAFDTDVKCEISSEIKIQFKYPSSMGRDILVTLLGHIVREMKLADDSYRYGVKLFREVKAYTDYVIEVQRNELKRIYGKTGRRN